jgi:uncharacterized damage-inducible protein DinB
VAGDERELLLEYLRSQRRHVAQTLTGLSEADARRAVLPSGWTMLGLVNHLRLDVERFWFRAVFAGEQVELCHGAEAWQVEPTATIASAVAAYETESALADVIIARLPLDAPVAWWPAAWGPSGLDGLRDGILHVIAETATHAGHLDAVRELIDGRLHLVLTGARST